MSAGRQALSRTSVIVGAKKQKAVEVGRTDNSISLDVPRLASPVESQIYCQLVEQS